eukprot:maker-scaffold919_size81109-snap-gene-0.18 protein:Tk04255 transcript:maker-scaffold919_size81109-snap-gene-0.18-mRNA-1 annotation:"ion transport peptide 3"
MVGSLGRSSQFIALVSCVLVILMRTEPALGGAFHPDGMYRVHKSIGETIGCKVSPTLKIYKTLNRVCDECFLLYREPDLYHMCRSDCFGSDYFMSCMDSLLTTQEAKMHHASLVENIHEYLR